MKIVVTILLGIAMAEACTPSSKEQFEKFKLDYGKKYECPELEKVRFIIFKKFLKKVEENNKAFKEGKSTFEMNINEFADRMAIEVPDVDACRNKVPEVITEAFTKFKIDFDRKYECPGLEELRCKIFEMNYKEIEEHNKKYEEGKSSYSKGINQFADMLSEEVPKGLLRPPKNK